MSARDEVHALQAAASYPHSGIIDCSHMDGTGSYEVEWAMVADGRLRHVDEVIDGRQQVRFFQITDAGRAWLAEAAR